jgi:uncharacterized integral membrane protein (TIGR00697 family)
LSHPDVFAYKTIDMPVFGEITTSGAIFILALFLSDIISEVWGQQKALFYMVVIVFCQCLVNLLLPFLASIDSPNSAAYMNLFHLQWRVFFAGLFGIFLSFGFNAYAINFLKNAIYTSSWFGMFIRDMSCNMVAKLIIVVVSYTIIFSGVLPIETILKLMIDTFIFKVTMGFLLTPIVPFCVSKINEVIDK